MGATQAHTCQSLWNAQGWLHWPGLTSRRSILADLHSLPVTGLQTDSKAVIAELQAGQQHFPILAAAELSC